MLEKFDLLRLLSEFGRVEPTGSYSYELMQVPDLDIKIYCQALDQSAIRSLGTTMADRSDVMGIRLLDFTKLKDGERQGVYLNIFPYFEGELWKFDLLFLLDSEPRKGEYLASKLGSVSPNKRDTILSLKAELLESGLYSHPTVFHNSTLFDGSDVYEAVIDGVELWPI